MNINYKIIETYPDKNQIVVRYFTDTVSELDLAVFVEPDGTFSRCVTDTCIDIPLLDFTQAQIIATIKSSCNVQFLEQKEMMKLAGSVNVPQVSHNTSLINDLADTTGSFTVPKLIPTSNEDWLDIKTKHLIEYRDNLIASGGFPLLYNGTTYWFHSNFISTCQQLGLISAAIIATMQRKPSTFVLHPVPWKTMGDNYVTLTVGLCLSLLQASFNQQGAIFQAFQAKKEALLLSSNAKDFDITTGWPITYSGN